jgi:hypothetical protein
MTIMVMMMIAKHLVQEVTFIAQFQLYQKCLLKYGQMVPLCNQTLQMVCVQILKFGTHRKFQLFIFHQ